MDAGTTLKPRSYEEIVADIVRCLKPLKHGSGDLSTPPKAGGYPGPIYAVIRLARVNFAGSITRARNIKATAKYLKKVRAKLGDDCPPKVALAIHEYVQQVSTLSERHDRFVDFCAEHALSLVKQFSTKRPVTTPFGNVHAIAQFIYEAVIGEPPPGPAF